jgi:hypothetical protein
VACAIAKPASARPRDRGLRDPRDVRRAGARVDLRTRIDSTEGARIWAGHGVLAHNLVKISALAG